MKILLMIAPALVLAGCQATAPTQPDRVEYRDTFVPIPIACSEKTPARPSMPTESLAWRSKADVVVDDFIRAAESELLLREAYEVELVTALENCKRAPVVSGG